MTSLGYQRAEVATPKLGKSCIKTNTAEMSLPVEVGAINW